MLPGLAKAPAATLEALVPENLEELRLYAVARSGTSGVEMHELAAATTLLLPAREEKDLKGPAAKTPRAAARKARTRAGAAEAAQARIAQPVATGKGEPPSAPRPPANGKPAPRPPVHAVDGKKYCGTCETTKPAGEFAKNTSRPDGLQSRCKPCSRAGTARSAEKRKEKAAGSAKARPAQERATTDRLKVLRERAAARGANGRHLKEAPEDVEELDFE